jgi:Tol biopolymer transport system component/DNA-binding winged helix-turn-helix (wHTH) protein
VAEFVKDHKPFVFRFGDFEVKEREFLLIKGGEATPLEPKAFRVLLFLLQNPGRLVKKDEILNAVWDDCSVSDNSLTRSIATLRRLLGDDAREPRYIATVQTVGYRFLCPVEVSEPTPDRPETSALVHTADQGQNIPDSRRAMWLVGAVIAGGVLILATWFGYRSVKARNEAASIYILGGKHSPKASVRVVQLTNLNGAVSWPAFSPDGRQIAFVWDAGEHPSRGDLYVQFVVGESPPLRLTHTRSEYVNPPTWLPNGREVAYGQCDDNGGAIYVVSALGGPEHRITDVPCPYGYVPPVSWSADGKSLILGDRCAPDGPISIVVFSMDTGAKHCLVALSKGEGMGDSGPVLSPDGQTVAFLRGRIGNNWSGELYTVPLLGGKATRLTADNANVSAFMWTADAKFICFNSTRNGPERTWRVPVGGGPIEPETTYPQVGALSRDGSRLVYSGPSAFSGTSVWRAELAGEGQAVMSKRQLLADSAHDYAPRPSPDEREIVFESQRSGHDEIWKSNADGSDPRKLTSLSGDAGGPRWSADGQWIVFDYVPAEHRQIFVIDSEGRNQHLVVSGNYDNGVPSWSRDGKAIYFTSDRTGSFQIWRHELATGRETQITQDGGLASLESFDAKTLYFSKLSGGGIWAVPVNGGEAQHVTDALHFGYWGEFAVTENGLYIIDSKVDPGPALMYYSFRTRQLRRIVTLNGPQKAVPWGANLDASRDGRTVLVILGTFRGSFVMAENLQ